MVRNREVVLPGVGVYDPRTHHLEGEVSRLRCLNVRQSVDRLTLNIHDPLDLIETLSDPSMARLKECSCNFIKDFSFGSLKRALDTAKFDPKRLKSFRVTATHGTIQPWQMGILRSLHRCISGARVTVCGIVSPRPESVRYDEVVTIGEDWFRHREDMIALYSVHLPWCESEIRRRSPRELVIDCDNQFNLPYLTNGILTDETLNIERLTLHDVTTTLGYFLEFLNTMKLPKLQELRLSSNDSFKWIRAIPPRIRGIKLWLNGTRWI